MKLRNKRSGEIVDFRYLQSDYVAPLMLTTYENNKPEMYSYNSLAELNEEWEDAPEEPKKYYWLRSGLGDICETKDTSTEHDKFRKSIGNYFGTREEAEKAVEKLKAWKRLKDKGFRFTDDLVYGEYYGCGSIRFITPTIKAKYVMDDLKLLFGGEE